MRTGWRAWTIRTAVVTVFAAVATVVIASPAQAVQPKIIEFSLSPGNGTINAGQTLKVRFKIAMNDLLEGTATWSVASTKPDKLQCVDQCGTQNDSIPAGGKPVEATFQTAGFFSSDDHMKVRVTATNPDGSAAPLEADVTIKATPTVPSVGGVVKELYTGEPIKTATIKMRDSVGTTWDDVATDDQGKFIITRDLYGKDIAAGSIILSVEKDGIAPFSKEFTGVAGQPLNVQLSVTSDASATPTTGGPAITPGTEATVIEEVAEGRGQVQIDGALWAALPYDPSQVFPNGTKVKVVAMQDETVLVAALDSTVTPTQPAAAPDPGMSTFSLMLIIVGGLLVLLGIGAIVLLFIRRGDEGDGPKPPKGGRGGPQQPGRGGPPGPRRPGGPPDRTAPMRPGYGPPRPGGPNRDQTTIARSPLADNPTQLRRPQSPGQPPFSGPPAPPQPGYGPPGGYPQQGGYGQQTYGGQPQYGPGPQTHGGQPPESRPREGRRVDWMDDY